MSTHATIHPGTQPHSCSFPLAPHAVPARTAGGGGGVGATPTTIAVEVVAAAVALTDVFAQVQAAGAGVRVDQLVALL